MSKLPTDLVCKHQRLEALHKWTKVKFGLIYIRELTKPII
jgi:hypothetical protein